MREGSYWRESGATHFGGSLGKVTTSLDGNKTVHSQVHRISYLFSFPWFLCTGQAKSPCTACIRVAGLGFDRKSRAMATNWPSITRVHNAVQKSGRCPTFSKAYMDICCCSTVGEMYITSPVGERFDPTDRIVERWPMAHLKPESCAGVPQ